MTASTPAQQSALASPLRLEILGLFTGGKPLAISDMARLMGRTAVSLYHHVGVLEKAGILERSGTRPKGKRFEALFMPAVSSIEMAPDPDDETSRAQALKTMSAAFRMAERDLEEALGRDDCEKEGPQRVAIATRFHMRASPKLLAGINRHIDAIMDLVGAESTRNPDPSPDDRHLSFTLALLPLKGREAK